MYCNSLSGPPEGIITDYNSLFGPSGAIVMDYNGL